MSVVVIVVGGAQIKNAMRVVSGGSSARWQAFSGVKTICLSSLV